MAPFVGLFVLNVNRANLESTNAKTRQQAVPFRAYNSIKQQDHGLTNDWVKHAIFGYDIQVDASEIRRDPSPVEVGIIVYPSIYQVVVQPNSGWPWGFLVAINSSVRCEEIIFGPKNSRYVGRYPKGRPFWILRAVKPPFSPICFEGKNTCLAAFCPGQ